MSIYLAWSIYQLIGALLIMALVVGGLWWLAAWERSEHIKNQRRLLLAIAVFWFGLILLAAFNVGDRQQNLTRSSFNATFPEAETVPAYVPPPPDHVKAARDALDKNILELNNSIKERKQ